MKLILGLCFVAQLALSSVIAQSKNIDLELSIRAVVRISNNAHNLSCVGALIHSEWVLTSAVCAIRIYKEEMRVYFLGTNSTDGGAHIKNVYIHPEFYAEDRLNDIALLQVDVPADQTIRIYKIDDEKSVLKAFLIKWTYWTNDNNQNNDITVYGYVYVVSTIVLKNEMCLNYPVNINSDKLCTYEALACEGDEGAPLVNNKNNKLIGLLSVSEEQAAICYFNNCILPVTTYTYVAPYLSWIKEITNASIV